MSAKSKRNDKSERLIVLTADIDNDLYRKTKISGPVMGRVQNLNAANQLALADPEETDANAIFQAVKLYDQLKEEGYLVSVATITGSETEGYGASAEISRQLDLVLRQNKADACIFVSDGASDDRILPIIQSRIKVNDVRLVKMKQAEKLENTYFVILEKLKEPHYARIIFGIPAMLLLLFSLSSLLGLGWQTPVVLIGVYLALKGFGIEDIIINSSKRVGFSIDSISFAFYLSSIIFLAASLLIAYENAVSAYQVPVYSNGSNYLLVYAYVFEGFMLLLPISLMLYLIGRIMDVKGGKYLFRSFKYGSYIGSVIVFWITIYSLTAWVLGQIYFSQFLAYTLASLIIGIAVSSAILVMKRSALRRQRLRGKQVINELGALIGKAGGTDVRKGVIEVDTAFGNSISYSMDRIIEITGGKIVVR